MNVVVVCPTPRGGHIEHAANLAMAFALANNEVVLVSRPGSSEYLPRAVANHFRIREALAPLRDTSGLRRLANRAWVLLHEHWTIRTLMKRLPGQTLVVFEEPRYPFPHILTSRRTDVSLVAFIHNVVEHAAQGGAHPPLGARLRDYVKRLSSKGYGAVIVHGSRQAEKIRPYVSGTVVSAPLPLSGWVERQWREQQETSRASRSLVCPGEIRPNKGYHLAIEAAKKIKDPLLIVGQPIDKTYLAELQELAASCSNIRIEPQFLSAAEFESLISTATAVLLPYVGFDAQSGVLARAVQAGRPVIASDLPSLREQAGNSPLVSFVPPGDVNALAEAIAFRASSTPMGERPDDQDKNSEQEWLDVAALIHASVSTA